MLEQWETKKGAMKQKNQSKAREREAKECENRMAGLEKSTPLKFSQAVGENGSLFS